MTNAVELRAYVKRWLPPPMAFSTCTSVVHDKPPGIEKEDFSPPDVASLMDDAVGPAGEGEQDQHVSGREIE